MSEQKLRTVDVRKMREARTTRRVDFITTHANTRKVGVLSSTLLLFEIHWIESEWLCFLMFEMERYYETWCKDVRYFQRAFSYSSLITFVLRVV